MSDVIAQGRDTRGLAARLWEYQAERFPVFKHGALIAAFGAEHGVNFRDTDASGAVAAAPVAAAGNSGPAAADHHTIEDRK